MRIFFFIILFLTEVVWAQSFLDTAQSSLKKKAASKEVYRKAIRENIPLLKTCFTQLAGGKIPANRSITLDWQVDDIGAVRYSKIKRSNIDNLAVNNCIKDKIKEIEFPAAPEGQLINILYLVEF
jgi:hypothetical protein